MEGVTFMTLGHLFRHFRQMKHYFLAAVLVFVSSMVIGWNHPLQYTHFLDRQLKGMEQLADLIKGQQDHQQAWMFLIIFLNNALKAALFVYFGVFFGVIPLFILVTNGMLIGYVSSLESQKEGIVFVLKAILPHGVIEIPALIIACAYGLKFGGISFKTMLGIWSPALRIRMRNEFRGLMKLSVPLIVLVVVMMLTAAVIESTVTPLLLQ
jgi:stage II sporulation protein M